MGPGTMRDTELYGHLLGLKSPWTVGNVELKVKEQRVDVWAEHGETAWPCPECGKPFALYDHAPERSWRHLGMIFRSSFSVIPQRTSL